MYQSIHGGICMKNVTVYAGSENTVLGQQTIRNMERSVNANDRSADKNKSAGSIFAGNIGKTTDSISLKKQQAQKKAMKLVSDALAGDTAIDDEIAKNNDKVKELKEDKRVLQDRVAVITENIEKYQEENGYIDTDELTELQEYQKQINKMDAEIEGLNQTVSDTKINRLKSSPMLEANKEAEEIMDSASKEILGMLFDEGKDHIDEEQKKQEEQAEALKEKKEEQEELIEKRKEDREEAEELTEEIIQGTDDVSGKNLSEVQQELKEILDKMKLIDEDIKGAQVDEVL
jgi:chromosome segregation ATPase